MSENTNHESSHNSSHKSSDKSVTQGFYEKSSALLDESADAIDGPTLSKLHQARSRAVERAQSRRFTVNQWVPAGAVAASFALVAVTYLQAPEPLPHIYEDPVQQATAQDMELLEDLEFIAWLAAQEDASDGVESS